MATIYDLDVLNKQVEILRDALAQYANPDNWEREYYDGFENDDDPKVVLSGETIVDGGKGDGYELAQAALEKADKLIHKDLWSENT